MTQRQQQRTTFYSNKKQVRDTYTQRITQLSTIEKQKVNISKIININFGEDALVIVSKTQLLIYSLLNMKPFYWREGFFWDAIFIPNTSLLAVVQHDGTQKSKRTLKILSLEKDQVIANVVVKFQIQSIKTSQHCICLAGVNEISIIHFPSLKPICYQVAGSGLKVIYDISYEGLTLAYQNQKKGQIIVHNFSGIETLKARRKSMQSSRKKSAFFSMVVQPKQNPKKIIQITAHKQSICQIRLSPNGSRVATASNKGTMIRIFLTQNGKLWQQLRISYQICTISDINFYQQGNVLSCLTQKGMVYLFNTKLQINEQKAQSQKRGYKIYQQANPKSMFSFLSFFYNNFGNQHSFAYFKLIRPKQQIQAENNNNNGNNSNNNANANKNEQKVMQIIAQQPQSNIRQTIEITQQKPQKLYQQLIQKQLIQKQLILKQLQQQPDKNQDKVQRSGSISSNNSNPNFKRSKSLFKKLNLLHNKKDNYDYTAKIYNTVSKVYIGGNNFIWAVKGPYIFSLKYDPFNGGQMYHKETLRFC